MKYVFSRFIAAILVLGILPACGPQFESTEQSGSTRVVSPWLTSQGEYSLQTIELRGLYDLKTLSGQFARFVFGPKVVDGKLQGHSPKGRFIKNSQNEYVPVDDLTQQMVVLYAHMQKFAELDEELGAGGVNTWPRDIGIAVRMKGGVKNNAFYDGKTDSMLFVPYTWDHLPISINGGILAHEHFHSLFYKLVIKGSLEEVIDRSSVHEREDIVLNDDELEISEKALTKSFFGKRVLTNPEVVHKYHLETLTSGLNEGLADFWGWVYSGDPDFIAMSIPIEKGERSLNLRAGDIYPNLPSQKKMTNRIESFMRYGEPDYMKSYLKGPAYSLGTQISRFLKGFTEIRIREREVSATQARKDVAKQIVSLLPQLKEKLLLSSSDKYFRPIDFVVLFAQQTSNLLEAECNFIASVLNNSEEFDGKQPYKCMQATSWELSFEDSNSDEK